jgi:hypothetical protein
MNQEGINNVMATNMTLGQQSQVAQPAQAQGLQTMLGQAPAQAQPVQGQGLQTMTGQAPVQAQPQGLQAMTGQTLQQPQQQVQPVEGPMVIQSTPSSMGVTPQEPASEPVINSNGMVSPQVEQPIVFDMGSSTTETQETTEPVQETAAPSTATPEKKSTVVVESLLGDEPKKEQAKPVVESLVSTGANNAQKQVDNLVVNTPGTGQGAETLEPAVVQTLNTPQTGGSIKDSVESLMGGAQTVVQSSGIPRHPEYTLDPEVAKKHEPVTVETL